MKLAMHTFKPCTAVVAVVVLAAVQSLRAVDTPDDAQLRDFLRSSMSNTNQVSTPAPEAPAAVSQPAPAAPPQTETVQPAPAAPPPTAPPASSDNYDDLRQLLRQQSATPTPAETSAPAQTSTPPTVVVNPAPESSAPVVTAAPAAAPTAEGNPAPPPASSDNYNDLRQLLRQQLATPSPAETSAPPAETATPPAVAVTPSAAPAAPAPAAAPATTNGYLPMTPPPSPISASQQQQLDNLLQLYKADVISPEEYHTRRAAILAGQ
jgi:hypothetical protein